MRRGERGRAVGDGHISRVVRLGRSHPRQGRLPRLVQALAQLVEERELSPPHLPHAIDATFVAPDPASPSVAVRRATCVFHFAPCCAVQAFDPRESRLHPAASRRNPLLGFGAQPLMLGSSRFSRCHLTRHRVWHVGEGSQHRVAAPARPDRAPQPAVQIANCIVKIAARRVHLSRPLVPALPLPRHRPPPAISLDSDHQPHHATHRRVEPVACRLPADREDGLLDAGNQESREGHFRIH